MNVISSGWTFFYKKIFPVLWLGFIAIFIFDALSTPRLRLDPVLLILPIPMIAVGLWFFYKLVWVLADQVVDNGDNLLVRRGSNELRVPFSEILNVGYSSTSKPARVSLRLRKAGAMGDEIFFMPTLTWRWSPLARNEVVEALIAKVDSAKRAIA